MFRIDRSLIKIVGDPNKETEEQKAEREAAELAVEEEHNSKLEEIELLKAEIEKLEEQKRQTIKTNDELTKRASENADNIINRAEDEAVEIKVRAQQDGYMEGQREADRLLEEARRRDEEMLKNVMSEISGAKNEMLSSIERDITGLVLDVVKKIFGQSFMQDGEMFNAMIVNALSQMKREGKITIHVGNQEYERFFADGNASFVIGDETISAAVVPDPYMLEGDLVIDSGTETVNAGFDSQLKYIEIAFKRGV